MATAAAGGDRLGEILLREGLVTREQLAQALAEQKNTKHRLGYVLVKLGLVQELEITKVLARQYRMPAVDLSRFEVDPKIIKLVPADMATKSVVLPLKREGRTLTVAMADPTDLGLLEDLKFITRFDLFPVIAGEYTLRNLIEKYYEASDQQLQSILKDMEETGEDVEVVEEEEDEAITQAQIDDAPVVKLING
ncbi:MAG TPA: type II secretion system protein GspE, partial [Gemmatimonadales bacterium]|nr:type II secretion system protein GspE [Gemmatimonadales bacterium]